MKSRWLVMLLVLALVVSVGAMAYLVIQVQARDEAMAAVRAQMTHLEVKLNEVAYERDLVQSKLDETVAKFQSEVEGLNSRIGQYQAKLLTMIQERQKQAEDNKPVSQRLPLNIGTFTTVDGISYNNVVIEAINENGIYIKHDAGGGTLPARRLPPDLRQALNLTDDKGN